MNVRVAFFALISLTSASCQAPPTPFSVGQRPFHFDAQQVQELILNKFDPHTGDQWFTRLQKNPKQPWKIASAPVQLSLLDLEADSPFIFHLIDSFKSLRIEKPAPRGSMESLGLAPPRFAVKWKTAEQEFEFKIGTSLPDGSGSYFAGPRDEIFVVSGSTLKLLSLIQDFKNLRQLRWSTFTANDVDEIEFFQGGQPYFYAQREGDVWTDRKHRPLSKNIPDFLEKLTELKSEALEDDRARRNTIRTTLDTQSSYQIDLSDRLGKKSTLKLKSMSIPSMGHSWMGLNSARAEAVFFLRPNVVHWIEAIAPSRSPTSPPKPKS